MQELFFWAEATEEKTSTMASANNLECGGNDAALDRFCELSKFGCFMCLIQSAVVAAALPAHSKTSRHISDDCHHHYVKQRDHTTHIEDQMAATILWIAINERHNK